MCLQSGRGSRKSARRRTPRHAPVRSRRAAALLSIAALGGPVAAAPAHAQLGGLLPSVGTIVTNTGTTLGGLLGGGGSALPDDVVNALIGTLLANSTAGPATPGGGSAAGPIILPGARSAPAA